MTDTTLNPSDAVQRTTGQSQRERILALTEALTQERKLRQEAEREAATLVHYIQSRATAEGVWDHRDVIQTVHDLSVSPVVDVMERLSSAQARGLPVSYAMFRALVTGAYENARAAVMQRMGDQGEACGAVTPELITDRMREDLRASTRLTGPLFHAA